MAGNIIYRGNGKFRFRTSIGTGKDRKSFSLEYSYEGKIDEGKLNDKKLDDSKRYPKAVRDKLAEFISEIKKGEYIEPTRMSLREYIDKWFSEYDGKDNEESTKACYKGMIDKRIIPAMGHMKLENIKPIHIKEFLNNLSEDGIREDGKKGGLGDSTIQKYHRILGSLFQDAVFLELIKTNPVRSVRPPKVIKKEAKFFETNEIFSVLDALTSEPYKYQIIVILDLLTGGRRGELVVLTWNKIDFENNSIRISSAAKYIPKKGVEIGETKNEMSKRTISFPAFIADVLKKYKLWQEEQYLKLGLKLKDSDYLFSWEYNFSKSMHPDTLSSWFPEFLKKHHLPKMKFHSLRHTHASLLMALDMDVTSAASRLGHSQKSTFLNIYSHMLKSRDKEASDRLSGMFLTTTSNDDSDRNIGHILDTYININDTKLNKKEQVKPKKRKKKITKIS